VRQTGSARLPDISVLLIAKTQGRDIINASWTQRQVEVKIPKLRTLPFETAIIERYRRRESSVEEALIEMYLVGISVRRVEDVRDCKKICVNGKNFKSSLK
jgi:transposase-like protein